MTQEHTHVHHEKWTPKLEKLIENYAEAFGVVVRDFANPETSMTGSYLRSAFRTLFKVKPLEKKICAEAGMDPKYDHSCAMVCLSEQNNRADLAESLRKTYAIASQSNKALEESGRVRAVKKAGININP